jgi:hypothetical protein
MQVSWTPLQPLPVDTVVSRMQVAPQMSTSAWSSASATSATSPAGAIQHAQFVANSPPVALSLNSSSKDRGRPPQSGRTTLTARAQHATAPAAGASSTPSADGRTHAATVVRWLMVMNDWNPGEVVGTAGRINTALWLAPASPLPPPLQSLPPPPPALSLAFAPGIGLSESVQPYNIFHHRHLRPPRA